MSYRSWPILRTFAFRLRVRNATLVLDDGSAWGSLELALERPYILPTASCAWLFDGASLGALGAGANCSSRDEGSNGNTDGSETCAKTCNMEGKVEQLRPVSMFCVVSHV